MRVRLSQAFGAPAVTIGSAHIANRAEGPSIVPGSDRALTFSGKATATMYAGQVLVSDAQQVQAGQPLVILDQTDARLALAEAQAAYARALPLVRLTAERRLLERKMRGLRSPPP